MKLPIKKIILIIIAALGVFFAFTYFDQWGGAVATSKTTNYKAKIEALKDNPLEASSKCPAMIKNLKNEIIQLKKKNTSKSKILANTKLIGDCALASKNYKLAIEEYQKIIGAKANFASIYRDFSKALLGDGNLSDALRYAHLSVQLKPTSFKNRINEARILAELNKTVKAIEAYQEALQIAPYKKADKVRNELNTLVDRYNLEKSGF